MSVTLTTSRLRLRPPHPDDAPVLFAILGDPRAMRYWSTEPHPDLATTRDWLARMIARPPGTEFIVEHDGKAIGRVSGGETPEIGFLFDPGHWGQGFAREATEALIAHIWATTDHPELTADVDPRNAASLGLLRRLGFTETGHARDTFFIAGQWCHSTYLTLKRPQTS
jgi:RimJ/RimL family protein N-acetyltransferase